MIDYGICPNHGTRVARVSRSKAEDLGVPYGCQACRIEVTSRPVPTDRGERATELHDLLTGPDYAGFDVICQRVDKLVGRSVFTHELAHPEYLEHEIRTGTRPSLGGIIAKFPPDMPVTVVVQSDKAAEEVGE